MHGGSVKGARRLWVCFPLYLSNLQPQVTRLGLGEILQRKITLRNRLNFALESLAARSGDYCFPSGISGVVVSPAGVASTMLISHVSKFLKVNDVGNIDGLKHRPTPPKKRTQEIPVVLVTGNFEQIAASLQLRDYLPHQAIRLGSPVFFLVPARLRARILNRLLMGNGSCGNEIIITYL